MLLKNEKGFTIIEVVLSICIVAVIAATIVPKFVTMSSAAKRAQCVANQSAIVTTGQLWYMEKLIAGQPAYYTTVEADLAPYFINNTFPTCPEGGTYALQATGDVSCSIVNH